MKKLALAVAALTVATPAAAQDFAGPRVGIELGLADEDFLGDAETTWGINAGYDVDLGNVIVGATVAYTDMFDDDFDFRELNVGGRVGTQMGKSALLYGTLGYSDINVSNISVDGVRVGVGAEFAMTKNVFVNLETRYGNYEQDIELYQTVIGLGYRF